MYHWIAIFEAENGKGSPRRIMEAKKSKEQEEMESLKSRISELEESLRLERLRNRLNEKIIDIAEARWHIEIRKKSWHQAVRDLRAESATECQVVELCGLLGVSKQAYYQHDEDAVHAKAAREEFAIQYIREVREEDPGIGGKKLWYMYQRDFRFDQSDRPRPLLPDHRRAGAKGAPEDAQAPHDGLDTRTPDIPQPHKGLYPHLGGSAVGQRHNIHCHNGGRLPLPLLLPRADT